MSERYKLFSEHYLQRHVAVFLRWIALVLVPAHLQRLYEAYACVTG